MQESRNPFKIVFSFLGRGQTFQASSDNKESKGKHKGEVKTDASAKKLKSVM